MTTTIPPAFLGVRDATAYSGLTRTRLFSLLKEGRLLARKAGRQTLLDRASIDSYLTSLPTWKGNAAA